MPESRHRTKHHHHTQHSTVHSNHAPAKAKRSAAFVFSILTAVLGLAVAYFTQGNDLIVLVIATAAGAIIGYLVGRALDKSIAKGRSNR